VRVCIVQQNESERLNEEQIPAETAKTLRRPFADV
jgi:hypothetical protein